MKGLIIFLLPTLISLYGWTDDHDQAVKSFIQTDTSFVKLKTISDDFVYDMRYATSNNFTGQKIYECDDCVLRKEVAIALKNANAYFIERGYRIKLYDCYRPVDVQKKFWGIYPDSNYVANPYTTGSIHNRGGAVDLTLVNLDREELDMGTAHDHFGIEAHHDYANLRADILENRRLLKEGMKLHGFDAIRTEWWHYNFKSSGNYALSNFPVQCN